MNEEKKLDKFTKYYDAFQKAIDKLDQQSFDFNDNGIDRKELEKITGQELEEDGEYLTIAQKSMSAIN